MGKKGFNENLLYVKIGRQLDGSDMEEIKVYLRNKPLSPTALEECKTFADICFRLEKKRTIVPKDLDFKFLSEMFEELDMAALKEEVETFVKLNKIKESDSRPINLRNGIELVRVRQRDRVENEILEQELSYRERHSYYMYYAAISNIVVDAHFISTAVAITAFENRLRKCWEVLTGECHEREWNAILNDPKRVSDLQVIEWVKMADRQKRECRELAERQIVEIKAFFDGINQALQEKQCAAQASSNGTVSGGQDSGNHSVPPDCQPNC